MFHIRTLFALGSIAAMFASGNSEAADPKPIPLSPAHVLIHRIRDENLQKELKVTPEQIKTLLAWQQKLWSNWYDTSANEYIAKTPERELATATALKECLDAEQFRRANELGLQIEWSRWKSNFSVPFAADPAGTVDPTRVSAEVLVQFSKVAEALELSDDQKKLIVDAPRPVIKPFVLLTPAQTEKARILLGKIVKTNWKDEFDPRQSRYYHLRSFSNWGSAGAPGLLGLTKAADIAADLKITDEQEKELAKLREAWKGFNPKPQEVSPAETMKKVDAQLAETDKSLATILKPDQMSRLRQLSVRADHDPVWKPSDTSLILNLAKELGVTAEQQKAFEAAIAKYVAAITRAARAEQGCDEAHKAILVANQTRDKEFEAVLTAEQKTKLKALVGEQLPSRVMAKSGSAFGSRATAFGHYTNELSLLTLNKKIQTELNLNDEQIAALKMAVQELSRRFANPKPNPFRDPKTPADPTTTAEQAEAKSKFIGEAIVAALDMKQMKRFREIMMQERQFGEANSLRLTVHSAITYPGVAEAVKLTAEQKKRLQDGEHPVAVLSDEQRKAIGEMLGERYTGDYATSTIRTPTTQRPLDAAERERAAFMVYVPWAATKLAAEDVTILVGAVNRYQIDLTGKAAVPAEPNPFRQPNKADQTVSRAVSALDREIRPILYATYGREWSARIDQLLLQSVAAVNLPKALARPEVMKELQLTLAQVVRINDAEDETGHLGELVIHAGLQLDKRNEILREVRERLDSRILATLTPEQLAKWKELTGERWDGFAKTLLYSAPIRRFGQ